MSEHSVKFLYGLLEESLGVNHLAACWREAAMRNRPES